MARWIRRGDCTFCGYCCRFPFDPVTLFFPAGNPKLEAFLRIRGFAVGTVDGQKGQASIGLVYQKCPYHVNDKCALWEKPERPQMCHDFPEKPSQVKNTPCSYWFEDADGVAPPIGGEGSPFPSGSLGLSESPTTLNPSDPIPEQRGWTT